MTSYVKNGIWYAKLFFQNVYQILINHLIHDKHFIKTTLNCSKWQKECQNVALFCISYIENPYKGHFAKTCLTTPLNFTSHEHIKVFLNHQTHLLKLNQSKPSPPRFFLDKMVNRSHFLILVNVTVQSSEKLNNLTDALYS